MRNVLKGFLVVGFVLNSGVFAQPELDTTFNSTGKVLTSIAGHSGAWNTAVQPDNKIIIVSGCSNTWGAFPFCLVRLNENGSLDTSFGNIGPPENPGPPGTVFTSFSPSQGQNGQATGIALQSDGKIIVTGTVSGGSNAATIARYNGDGTLDTTFGTGGKIYTNISGGQNWETVRAVAVQPDGKIVITGDSMRIIPPPTLDNIWSRFVARFLPNGTLDSSFGIGGVVKTNTGSISVSGQSLAIQPDGKILVGGNLWTNDFGQSPPRAYYVARLNSDGTADQNWATPQIPYLYSDGPMGPHIGITTVAVQPDGRVVAVSQATRKLFRFLHNGSPDTSFDGDGTREVFLEDQLPFDFEISGDGRITVVGMVRVGPSSITDYPYIVERFMPDGSYDGTFGNGGRRYIYISSATKDGARAIALDQIGRPVIAGVANDTPGSPSFWDHTIISAVRLTASAINPAPVTITGRVLTAEGLPVSGITMKMADSSGLTRLSRTNPFGYYQFSNIMSGQLYTIAAKSRAISITERSIFVSGQVLNFDFTAAPQTASKGERTISK